MNHQQLELLRKKEENKSPRIFTRDIFYVLGDVETTLLYGYTLERSTFHIYLKNEKIHKIIYDFDSLSPDFYSVNESFSVEDLIPSKRAYPCRTLHSFSDLIESLLRPGAIPFTNFPLKEESKFLTESNLYFAGKIKEDFTPE